jgi:hypothetical protein
LGMIVTLFLPLRLVTCALKYKLQIDTIPLDGCRCRS